MKNIKQNKTRAIQVVSILAALTFAPPALAEGCTATLDPPQPVVDVGEFDGNMTCANWPSMVPSDCSLDPAEGEKLTCRITTDVGDIDVTAMKVDGWISWSSSSDEGLGIDKVILDNAAGANGCLQNNMYDATSGEIVFLKLQGGIAVPQSTKGAEFCADVLISEKPPVPPEPEVAEPLHQCQAENTGSGSSIIEADPGSLDNTGIICPVYATQDECDAAEAGNEGFVCIPEVTQKPVVVCNLEKDKEDWGTTDGSDVCCQCGIPENIQEACIVTQPETDTNQCTHSMTVDPTQTVELIFFKDDVDPCTWKKTSKGWVQVCFPPY